MDSRSIASAGGFPETEQTDLHQDRHQAILRDEIKNKKEFERIEAYMNESRAYLQDNFSQEMMVKATVLSSYKLRGILKSETGHSFPDYANRKRIQFLLKMLESNKHWRIYNTATLTKEIGYKSVNTFYTIFKKVTGKTPKGYIEKTFD